jgi:hypothetical protein
MDRIKETRNVYIMYVENTRSYKLNIAHRSRDAMTYVAMGANVSVVCLLRSVVLMELGPGLVFSLRNQSKRKRMPLALLCVCFMSGA